MTDMQTLSLKGEIDAVDGIEFLKAEWWSAPPRFVVLRYKEYGEKEGSLRLDMAKRIFLDHLSDPKKDAALQRSLYRILDVIANHIWSREKSDFRKYS